MKYSQQLNQGLIEQPRQLLTNRCSSPVRPKNCRKPCISKYYAPQMNGLDLNFYITTFDEENQEHLIIKEKLQQVVQRPKSPFRSNVMRCLQERQERKPLPSPIVQVRNQLSNMRQEAEENQ